MKTTKELDKHKSSQFRDGYEVCREDLFKLIDDLIEEENYCHSCVYRTVLHIKIEELKTKIKGDDVNLAKNEGNNK